MQALIQRVLTANVSINGQVISQIERGLLLFLGFEKDDSFLVTEKLLAKILNYRVFPDDKDKMNHSVCDIRGELLIVSQFTLAANTQKGLRPSFSSAMHPSQSKVLFDEFVALAKRTHGGMARVEQGQFGADMQIALVNDGPVTFMLQQY